QVNDPPSTAYRMTSFPSWLLTSASNRTGGTQAGAFGSTWQIPDRQRFESGQSGGPHRTPSAAGFVEHPLTASHLGPRPTLPGSPPNWAEAAGTQAPSAAQASTVQPRPSSQLRSTPTHRPSKQTALDRHASEQELPLRFENVQVPALGSNPAFRHG